MLHMKYVALARNRAGIAAVTAALALLSLAPGATTSLAATLTPSGNAPHTTISDTTLTGGPAESIIMRDGGICDPIRHMGC